MDYEIGQRVHGKNCVGARFTGVITGRLGPHSYILDKTWATPVRLIEGIDDSPVQKTETQNNDGPVVQEEPADNSPAQIKMEPQMETQMDLFGYPSFERRESTDEDDE